MLAGVNAEIFAEFGERSIVRGLFFLELGEDISAMLNEQDSALYF